MSKLDQDASRFENGVVLGASQQNWGVFIGVGIVVLGLSVVLVNLWMVELSWGGLRIGRMAAVGGGVSIVGWLLWRLLKQRQPSDQSYLEVHLRQAIHYIQNIETLLQTGSNGHEKQLLAQIYTWWQTIEAMVETLANLGQNDAIIQHDLRHLPDTVADFEEQLAAETNPQLRVDLEQMLTQRRHQLAALEQLQTTRRRAEIQIERTIAVLGTIYSQLLTYRSTFHVVDYQLLADDVAEEVQQLQDYLEALQEVKAGRGVSNRS